MVTTDRALKVQMAGETRAREIAQRREKAAVLRAENAEKAVTGLTEQLEIAREEIGRLKALLSSLR